MVYRRLTGEEPTQEIINFDVRLREMAIEEGLPESAISDRGFQLAADLLELVRRNHGDPDQPSYKEHHNDGHGLDFIRYFWRQWVPLSKQFPDIYDQEGFELGMLIGAGHDSVYDPDAAVQNPGRNEQYSAELSCQKMYDAGYKQDAIKRVNEGVIKTTTVKGEDDIIQQIYMRSGSQDVLGHVAGLADMNSSLMGGEKDLLKTAVALGLEDSETPSEDTAADQAASLARVLLYQKSYVDSRIAVLAGDLEHYIDDKATREAIVQVYWDNFRLNSVEAMQTAEQLHSAPARTKQLIEEALASLGKVKRQKLSRAAAISQHLLDHLKTHRNN
jgi:hypothetical protein